MRQRIVRLIASIAVLGVSSGLIVGCAPAVPEKEAPKQFYEGKTISVLTGKIGGTQDLIARAFAPFLEKELGVKTKVVNATRGTVPQSNDLYKAKPDGLTMGIVTITAVLPNEIFETPGTEYESTKFEWVSSFAFQPSMFIVSPKKPYRSIEDLQKAKGLKLISSSPRGFYTVAGLLAAWILDLDAKIVTGASSAEMLLSVQKGEADGCAWTEAKALPAIEGGQAIGLFAIDRKSELFPDLPVLVEVAEITKIQRQMIEGPMSLSYSLITPPGVPQDRLDFLERAVKKIHEEQGEVLAKKVNLPKWIFIMQEEAEKLVEETMKSKSEIKQAFETQLEKYS